MPRLPAALRRGSLGRIDWPFASIVMATAVIEFGLIGWAVTRDWPVELVWQASPDDFRPPIRITEASSPLEMIREAEQRQAGAAVAAEVDEPPAAQPPDAAGPALTPAERAVRAERRARAEAERYARVALALAEHPRIELLTFRGERGGAVEDVLGGGGVSASPEEILGKVPGGVRIATRVDRVLRGPTSGSGAGLGKAIALDGLRAPDGGVDVRNAETVEEHEVHGAVEPERPIVDDRNGWLDPAKVRSIVGRNLGGIKACYEGALRRSRGLGGRVTITFTIGATGRVTGASPSADTIGAGVGDCVARRVRLLAFPSPENGSVTVSYPFFFQPAAR